MVTPNRRPNIMLKIIKITTASIAMPRAPSQPVSKTLLKTATQAKKASIKAQTKEEPPITEPRKKETPNKTIK